MLQEHMSKFTIVGLGEVLWDVFSTHKQLGGAPANFAYICGLLGDDGVVASRIGADALGDEVVARLEGLELDVSNLQRDAAHATGTVKVEVGSDGQPRFEITRDVAWDFLEWTPQLQTLAARADAVCFGSLAQRGLQSRETIEKFVAATRENAVRVFDVNLRQAFYSAEVLAHSAESADILKLNHEEVPIVLQSMGGPKVDELRSAQWLCRRFELQLVCVTRGSSGSLLVSKDAHAEHPGFKVTVVDTVGAGDAFTATLVHHYLRGSNLATMNRAANQMGAWVTSKTGATPPIEAEEIKRAQAS
jgi:fructokinase